MKVMESITEVAEVLFVPEWEVQKELENSRINGRITFNVGGTDVNTHIVNKKAKYVIFNIESNEDCKKYMMEYEKKEYNWEVKTDDIVGVEKCEVIDITNTKMGIDRATVITESGTQLNRRVVFVTNKEDEDYKQDGCIYFWEKE
ncbi:MAG: hypothetical protein ACRC68_01030 [Clostridium sp.]